MDEMVEEGRSGNPLGCWRVDCGCLRMRGVRCEVYGLREMDSVGVTEDNRRLVKTQDRTDPDP